MREVVDFIVHLRLHYQVLILPAGFLLGALFQDSIDLPRFLLQFLNVHLLLNGGVTAYNSFWDKDEGPIGGLERPPPMKPWMHHASIAIQVIGLLCALPLGLTYAAIYTLTMILSIFYSRPRPRWKGHPLLSLVAVGVGTGTNTFLLGYLAAGPRPLEPFIFASAVGVATLLLSLYPISQVYQLEADGKRNDTTFAMRFGLSGVKRFFFLTYPFGLLLLGTLLTLRRPEIGAVFAVAGLLGGTAVALVLRRLQGIPAEYRPVMKLKYFVSLTFTLFVVASLVWVQTQVL